MLSNTFYFFALMGKKQCNAFFLQEMKTLSQLQFLLRICNMLGHVSCCAINYKLQGNEGKQFQTIGHCLYQMSSLKLQSVNEHSLSFFTISVALCKNQWPHKTHPVVSKPAHVVMLKLELRSAIKLNDFSIITCKMNAPK